jgi:hypothetical protein
MTAGRTLLWLKDESWIEVACFFFSQRVETALSRAVSPVLIAQPSSHGMVDITAEFKQAASALARESGKRADIMSKIPAPTSFSKAAAHLVRCALLMILTTRCDGGLNTRAFQQFLQLTGIRSMHAFIASQQRCVQWHVLRQRLQQPRALAATT